MTRLAFNFTPRIPAEKEAVIQSRLSEVERDFGVRFLFAIESGSRAWGFPSPDSDFDVRFVYAHDPDWYLSIEPGRDVIELPIEDDWDINGWDIKKAIGLLLKPNPVLIEWLCSPIRYRWNEQACSRLQNFAERVATPTDCIPHYYHLAKRQWDRNNGDASDVNLKKYFYVLRPALALRWVRMNPDQLPPMNFQKLVDGTALADALLERIGILLEQKARASEIGSGARIPEIDALIANELDWARANMPDKQPLTQSVRDSADTLFRDLIKQN